MRHHRTEPADSLASLTHDHAPRTVIALLPPKAKPLFCTTRTVAGRAVFGTGSTQGSSGSGVRQLIVGGRKPCVIASAPAMAPKPLAAPIVWPSIDLIELIGGTGSPNTSRTARAS